MHDSGQLFLISNDVEKETIHEKWLEDACPHPQQMVTVGISWLGVAEFRDLLTTFGSEKVPVLLKELPVTNDGQMPVDIVRAALSELQALRAQFAHSRQPEIDQSTIDFMDKLERVFSASIEWERPVVWT